MRILSTLFLITLLFPSVVLGGLIPAVVVDKVHQGVFEIIVPKLEDSPIKYERPLPWANLPFAERNDKYQSIGSAFLVRDNVFATAGHVLDLNKISQMQPVYIRTQNQQVYEIDSIISYSFQRDFALFTVKGAAFPCPFTMNAAPKTNTQVFAVGNALGEGVVIREGILTSETFEEQFGEWKWLRFSAAASPGNSGGPLLDENGNVDGIILKKSMNENLNFALPISEILAHPLVADLKVREVFSLNVSTKTHYGIYQQQFPLPQSVSELRNMIHQDYSVYYTGKMDELLATYNATLFPNGDGSQELLHDANYKAGFPALIAENDFGNWILHYPSDLKRTPIGQNGLVEAGALNGVGIIYLHKPDNVTVRQMVDDTKLLMDLILKGIYLNRDMGIEKIKIVSLGTAAESDRFQDNYGRHWRLYSWLLPYSNQKLSTVVLPVPDGLVLLMYMDETGQLITKDMQILTNFLTVNYQGTFPEWTDYLSQDYCAQTFKQMKLSVTPATVTLQTPTLKVTYPAAILNRSEKNLLNAGLVFHQPSAQHTDWLLNRFTFIESRSIHNYLSVTRHFAPVSDMRQEYHDEWAKLTRGVYPYNQSVVRENGENRVFLVLPAAAKQTDRFSLCVNLEGDVSAADMKKQLQQFRKGVHVVSEVQQK